MAEEGLARVEKLVRDYVGAAVEELRARWKLWQLDLTKREVHEAVEALLARQVSLATNLACSPGIWNGHIAPLVLRSMVEAYITLAWVFVEPVDRARKYILYGLGQEKLEIEHRKRLMQERGKSPDDDPVIGVKETWLNSQRYAALTEVNVGSWSGATAREMAEEAGCADFYHYAYVPFSACTHNMWHHVSRYNLQQCPNPLHAYHQVPICPDVSPDPDYVYIAAKYVDKTFRLFDDKTGVKVSVPNALEVFEDGLSALGKEGA